MDRHARTPEPLSINGNMSENWRNWREDFLIFMTVTEYNKKSSEMKANLLKNLIGKVGLQAINSFTYDDPVDKDDFGIILSKLDYHFDPPKTETEQRYAFFTTKRQAADSTEEFINKLREKAKVCNFGPLSESLVRDKVVLDTKDSVLRKKYMSTESLTLEKLISIDKDHKPTVRNVKPISKENADGKAFHGASSKPNEKRDGCWRCGRRHPPKNCPAWGAKCEKCGEKNHFGHCCPKAKSSNDVGKGYDKNLFDTFYQNNTTKKGISNPLNTLGSTGSTSAGPQIDPNNINFPNHRTGEPKNLQQSVPTQSGNQIKQQLPKSKVNSTTSTQAKERADFVLVPPPRNNSVPNNHYRYPQPKSSYSTQSKPKPKKNDECVIS